MNKRIRNLSLVVIILGVVALAMGAVFVQQGFSKEAWLIKATEQEQIEIPGEESVIINSAETAQAAADIVREHRRGIAPTYGDLLGGEKFNPTDPTQLSYGQAMNIENYLYLAVTAFGVFAVVKAIGAFMIVTGLALGTTGYILWQRADK
ncbi:MAG: hypothetical protein A2158_03580 [Chloroflexi bacterium RBG_13_46_14]|nr:MAG: hypothetical protein A2158_03580 [Chloroflexi bacterium RBG_13_46_14]